MATVEETREKIRQKAYSLVDGIEYSPTGERNVSYNLNKVQQALDILAQQELEESGGTRIKSFNFRTSKGL